MWIIEVSFYPTQITPSKWGALSSSMFPFSNPHDAAGKTQLRFVEGYKPGQGHLSVSKCKKKTVTCPVYTGDMCPAMFDDIEELCGDYWVWIQDGAKPHTAIVKRKFIADRTSAHVRHDEWPAKSPDLNPMDY